MPDETAETNDVLQGVNVEVRICVGSASPTVRELLGMQVNTVLPLDKKIEDPVELFIGERRIGAGHLEEVEGISGQLAVRLTSVGDVTGGPT